MALHQHNPAQRQQIRQQRGQQGLPPGIDPRAVAADPQGFARQQAQLQQAGGDPRRAAIAADPQGFARQQAQQRLASRGQGGLGQQGLLGRMLAQRQQGQFGQQQALQQGLAGRQQGQQRGQFGLPSPRAALGQRLQRRRRSNQSILKRRLVTNA